MKDPVKRPSKLKVVLFVLGLTIFVVFSWVLVPRALTASYKGEGIPALDRVIAGLQRSKVRPLEKFLSVWAELRMLVTAIGLGIWFLSTPLARRLAEAFSRRFVVPCTPGTLGAIRWLVFGLLLISVLEDDLSSVAYLPTEILGKMGFLEILRLLPYRAFEALHHSHRGLFVFQVVTGTLILFGAVGLWTRLTVPLAAVCYFVFGGILRECSHFYHAYLLSLYLAVALAFMPCADGWSLDRLIRLVRGKPVPDRDAPTELYGWCRMICWALIAVTYLLAGMSKIANGGLDWLSADNMRGVQVSDTLNPSSTPLPRDWALGLRSLDMPDLVLSGMALMAMMGEFFYIAVLFSTWARRFFPALMAGMHTGIILFQGLFFLDSILIQSIFWDWRVARLWLAHQVARRKGVVSVVINPDDPSSTRIEAVLRELDLFNRLHFVDAPSEGVPTAGPFPVASTADGRVFVGPKAVRYIASCLPLIWPVSILAGQSWAISLTSRLWSTLTGRSRSGDPQSPIALSRRTPEFALFSVLVWYFIISYVNWSVSREIYPISGWGMYSGGTSEKRVGYHKIAYFKVLAHFEDGRVEPAKIGNWIGVMNEGRYKDYVFGHFVREEEWSEPEKLVKLLNAAMKRANATAAPGHRVVGIETQAWNWAYRDPEEGPTKGRMYKQRYFPAPK